MLKMKEDKQLTIIKAFFFGQKNSGKTSLLMRQTQNTFTNELQFTGIELYMKEFYINGEVIKAQLWDTPTFQRNEYERFSYPLPTYLKRIALFGICFDLSRKKSFQVGKGWYKKIKQMNAAAKLYLIGCKSDLEHQIGKEQINEYQYYQVSSKDNKGVNESILKMVLEGLKVYMPNQRLVVDKPQPPRGWSHYCSS